MNRRADRAIEALLWALLSLGVLIITTAVFGIYVTTIGA